MAIKIEELGIIISANTEALGKELLGINQKLNKFGSQVEKISPKTTILDKFTSSLFDMGKVAGGIVIANTFGRLQSQMGGFIGAMVQGATDAQQTALSFEVMLGSVEKSKTLLKEITDFAYVTPFQLDQVQEMAKRLLAYGVAQDDIIPTMRVLGNISSAVGKDKLPQLITAFGQIKAKGRLMGQELLQLSETGLPVREALIEVYNATNKAKIKMSDFDKVMEKGGFTFGMVQKALESYGGASGKWGNLMDRQSKTFGGMVSNAEDFRDRMLSLIGGVDQATGELVQGGLLDTLSDKLQEGLGWIDRNKENITSAMKTMSEWFGKIVDGAVWLGGEAVKMGISLKDAFGDRTSTLIGKVVGWVKDLIGYLQSTDGQALLKKIGDTILAVVDAGFSFVEFLTSDATKKSIGDFVKIVTPILNIFLDIVGAVARASSAISGFLGQSSASNKISKMQGAASAIANNATAYNMAMKSGNTNLANRISKDIQLMIKGLDGNAEGTNNWRGGLTWVGERGPELVNLPRGSQVIPNDKVGGVGKTANITNNFYNTEVDANMLASRLNFQLNMI